MSTNSDSRKPGSGLFPLQHQDFDKNGGGLEPWSIDMRSCVLAWRIKGRDDANGGIGQWLYDPDSVGDLHGGQLWNSPLGGNRPCAMWRFATPVAISDLTGTNGVVTGPGGGSLSMAGQASILPLYDDLYSLDRRFINLKPGRPIRDGKEAWPKFPIDYFGISLSAGHEPRQLDLFMPTDPRLIAVNKYGDTEMGSYVCEMAPGFKIDLDRMAHLQSMMRVLVNTTLCSGGGKKVIAWNVGPSGMGDTRGGYMFEARGGNGASPSGGNPSPHQDGLPTPTGMPAYDPNFVYGYDPNYSNLNQAYGGAWGEMKGSGSGGAGGVGGGGAGPTPLPPPPGGGGAGGGTGGKANKSGGGGGSKGIDGFGYGVGYGFYFPDGGSVPIFGNKGINIDGFGFGGGWGWNFGGKEGFVPGTGGKGASIDGFGFGSGYGWVFPGGKSIPVAGGKEFITGGQKLQWIFPKEPYFPPFAKPKPKTSEGGPGAGVQQQAKPESAPNGGDPAIDLYGNPAMTMAQTLLQIPAPTSKERITNATGVISMMSQFDSGLMEVGLNGDKHTLGSDGDGHEIHASHVSSRAYFYDSIQRDAPLEFGTNYREPSNGPYLVKTYLRYDARPQHGFACGPRYGLWRWESECFFHEVPGDDGGGTPPAGPPPPKKPPPPPGVPTGDKKKPPKPPDMPTYDPGPSGGTSTGKHGGGGGPEGGGGGAGEDGAAAPVPGHNPPLVSVFSYWDSKAKGYYHWTYPTNVNQWMPGRKDGYSSSHRQIGVPAINGVPQDLHKNATDMRRLTGNIPDGAAEGADNSNPTTGRIEAFGSQQGCSYNYTQRPSVSRYRGGTANGGFALMPPEYDITDHVNNFSRPNIVNASTTYFTAVPGAYWAVGTPRIETGGVKTGYRWGGNSAGDLIFSSLDSSGTATEVMKFDSTGAATLPSASSVKMGTGSGTATVKGTANVGTTDANNSGTGETDLMTYSLPANSLSANSKGLHFFAQGKFAATANGKTLKFKFGTATITLESAAFINDYQWSFDARIYRTSGNNQKIAYHYTRVASAGLGTAVTTLDVTTATETDTSAITIKMTGQSDTASNDVTQELSETQFYN